jgi:hypothetical protein
MASKKQSSRGRRQDRARVAGGQVRGKEVRQVKSGCEKSRQEGWEWPEARREITEPLDRAAASL